MRVVGCFAGEQVEFVEEVLEGEVLIDTFDTPFDNGNGLSNVGAPEAAVSQNDRSMIGSSRYNTVRYTSTSFN